MSRGLLSGLNKAEKSPYAGWKTNSFVEREPSPENDEVCLLDDDQGPSTPSDSKKCLSDGVRNPWEFSAKSSQFQIPKRPSGSPDDKDKKGQQWFDSSFDEEVEERHVNCQTRPHNQKQRNNANYANKQKAARMDFEERIGYRICRQALNKTPKTRWKHTHPPGTLSPGRGNNVTSSARESSPYQVTNARVPEKCNGHVSADTTKSHVQRNCSSLDEEQKQNLSVLDHIMTGKSVAVCAYSDGDDTGSDSNFREKSRLSCVAQGTPSSSKDLLSDDNYEDCFGASSCKKCNRLLQDKKCPNCDKDIFPSQAATTRKSLSAERFYSSDDRQPKVQRKYSNNRSRGNGIPKLLETGSVAKMPDANKQTKEDETSQTSTTVKKRKNQEKSNSEDSDSEQRPQVKKKRSGRQTKLAVPKKVDVITLSDEEESIEEMTELVVEKSKSSEKELASSSVTVIPESPVNQEKATKQSVVESNSENSPETAGKRKTPPSKEERNSKKSGHAYGRDDLEVEIMLGQDVRIGTLACTATKPLKITCHNDEIKLDVDYGNKNCLLTISGNDLASFKINTTSNPGVIVLGVTPGYALRLTQRIQNKGTFLKPGSAVTGERDIVLEVSEHVKRETIADLMEWVTDKLSKEFAELSLKEVERIMSYKASASTSNEQNQSSDEVTKSPPMSTRSRTYNTRTNSSKQPSIAPQTLVVYPPPPQPDGIIITTEDVACLAPDEFLNDVIIDFYLKFVFFEKLKAEDRARTHILSSFFYKRLTQRSKSNSDSFASTEDRMHYQVRTWTKNVDIFEKDFVIVPINESSHWYLAVICFAGQKDAAYVNEINDEDDETDTKNEATDTKTGTEQESGSDDEFEFSPLAIVQKKPAKRTSRNSKKGLSKQIIKSQPCILVFDSLGGSRTRCMLNLRNYLRCEWRERKKEPTTRIFDTYTIKGNHPKVPQQDNFCDCGVYVLQYMESFFKDPITDFSLPIRKPDWFLSIAQKRSDIRGLIYHLKASAEIDDT